ncbi:MAG: PP2C family protein-serine/threonine phosphatase [Fibrobacteria bacterium]|nr:PP2C family protein-serine/threonine phosphatase [Fibrobacteria bacterium]
MSLDVEALQLAIWLLPLPLLLFMVGGTGLRTRWSWIQVAALSLLAILQLLVQATAQADNASWFPHRQHIWIAAAIVFLGLAQSESIALALDREVGRKRRMISSGTSILLLGLAAFLPGQEHSLPLLIGAASLFGLHEINASLLPGPLWQRVLRALIVGFFAWSMVMPSMLLPLSAATVLSVALDTMWMIRRETLQRLSRARESLKPQALKDLLASSVTLGTSDEEAIPVERLQALLAFAVQSTSATGGAIFLYHEAPTEVGTTSRRLVCVASEGALAKLRKQDSHLPAQILLSRMGEDAVHAVQLDPDARTDAFVLRTWDVSSIAAVPVRTRGRTLGLLAVSGRESLPRFGPRDRQLLEFLGMQAAFSLHYDTVYHQLQEESRLAREFEIAAGIQRGLLPRAMPETLNLEIASRLLPAREVGGDYVDLIPLSDDRLLGAIGDVSGKGLGPGMIMLIVRTILHVLVDLQPNTSPSILVRTLEEKLVPQLGPLTFMTFLLLRWNGRDRSLTWCGAGHESMILVNSAGAVSRIKTGGLALGIARDRLPAREEKRIQLSQGDTLLLFTDGVSEGRNPAGEAWGIGRLETSLSQLHGRSAQEILEGLIAELERFRDGAPAHDDRTLLVLRVV